MSRLLAQVAQTGDRWEIPSGAVDALLLDPAWDVLLDPGGAVALIGSAGLPVMAHYDAEQHALRGEGLGGLIIHAPGGSCFLEMEAVSPPRFRVVAESETPEALSAEVTTDRGIRLAFDADDLTILTGAPMSLAVFDLSRRAAEFAASPGFDNLISLPMLREVDLYPHQLQTVKTVLRRFRGRALLCGSAPLPQPQHAAVETRQRPAQAIHRASSSGSSSIARISSRRATSINCTRC